MQIFIMELFIDTHCHLDTTCKKLHLEHPSQLRQQYLDQNCKYVIHVSCDPESIECSLEYLDQPWVYCAIGIHPHDAKYYTPALHQKILQAHAHPKVLAWGEMGLDYHYMYSSPPEQEACFIKQIEAALELAKPLVIHTREAEEETLKLMKQYIPPATPMHVHCFTSSPKMAATLLEFFPNLYLGFTGVVTFKKSTALEEIIRFTPSNRWLLETDSPYLAPEPLRGKTCHSGYIPLIAQKIANVRQISLQTCYEQAYTNSINLYKIP